MTCAVFGHDTAEVERKLGGSSRAEADKVGIVTGSADEIVYRLGALADSGVQRVMLQYMETDDMDTRGEHPTRAQLVDRTKIKIAATRAGGSVS
jgi:hypothetical protein